MSRTSHDRTTPAGTDPRPDTEPQACAPGTRGLRERSRLLLAPLAGTALVAGLLAGCGGTTAADDTATADEEVTGQDEDTGADDSTDSEGSEGSGESEGSDGSDGGTDAEEGTLPSPLGENLFAGTWGFGHDTKSLTAEDLAELLMQEASARGPEGMSLEVECGDGIDSEAGDLEAECIAYADEGVEHLWQVSVGPAGEGLDIEITNVG